MHINNVGITNSCEDDVQQQRDSPSDEVCERCQEHGHIYEFISDNTSLTMEKMGLPEPQNVTTELNRERLMYTTVRRELMEQFTKIHEIPTWNIEFAAAFDMVRRVHAQGGGYCVIERIGRCR